MSQGNEEARAEQIAAGLSPSERLCLVDLFEVGEPWLMSDHDARRKFYDLGLVEAVFPHAKQNDTGLQHWLFNRLGRRVYDAIGEKVAKES